MVTSTGVRFRNRRHALTRLRPFARSASQRVHGGTDRTHFNFLTSGRGRLSHVCSRLIGIEARVTRGLKCSGFIRLTCFHVCQASCGTRVITGFHGRIGSFVIPVTAELGRQREREVNISGLGFCSRKFRFGAKGTMPGNGPR